MIITKGLFFVRGKDGRATGQYFLDEETELLSIVDLKKAMESYENPGKFWLIWTMPTVAPHVLITNDGVYDWSKDQKQYVSYIGDVWLWDSKEGKSVGKYTAEEICEKYCKGDKL